jgi:peptidyl-tRNA hydrolase, PTH2 family
MAEKLVIVMRKDLNMRKGKMIAQGAHAAVRLVMDLDRDSLSRWFNDGETKICVGVNSEVELLDVYCKARAANLPTALIKDAGRTEFQQPTFTCCGIGPSDISEIDKITGELQLL